MVAAIIFRSWEHTEALIVEGTGRKCTELPCKALSVLSGLYKTTKEGKPKSVQEKTPIVASDRAEAPRVIRTVT